MLQGYYINDRRKSENYKEIYKYEQYKSCSRVTTRNPEQERLEENTLDSLPLIYYATLRNSDQQKVHYGPIFRI